MERTVHGSERNNADAFVAESVTFSAPRFTRPKAPLDKAGADAILDSAMRGLASVTEVTLTSGRCAPGSMLNHAETERSVFRCGDRSRWAFAA